MQEQPARDRLLLMVCVAMSGAALLLQVFEQRPALAYSPLPATHPPQTTPTPQRYQPVYTPDRVTQLEKAVQSLQAKLAQTQVQLSDLSKRYVAHTHRLQVAIQTVQDVECGGPADICHGNGLPTVSVLSIDRGEPKWDPTTTTPPNK